MKILALEASAVSASCAIIDDNKLVGEFFLATGQTHSQTLMPMAENLLNHCNMSVMDMDFLAVSTGPGSFTGLRIAVSALKGMAMGADKPCIGVSTLEALAYNLLGHTGYVLAVMDARCSQVYTALFSVEDKKVLRVWEDMAIPLEELAEKLQQLPSMVTLVGDGAQLCYTYMDEKNIPVMIAHSSMLLQHASSVAAYALGNTQKATNYHDLAPDYLRLPQAERELLAKKSTQKT